jgi:phosphatidylinositol alpha-1,6-mannosyltransferase
MAADRPLLVLTPDFPPARGGIQVLVEQTARHLRGFRPVVVAPAAPGARALDRTLDVEVRRAGHAAAPRQANIAAVGLSAVALAASREFVGVLAMHIVTAPAAMLAARRPRIPVVLYAYAREITGRPRLARWACPRADRVIAISGYTEQLVREAGAAPDRIRRVLPGVELAETAPEVRRSLTSIVTVARLEDRYKGHDVLIRAMPLVRSRVPGARLTVIGDGPLRPYLEGLSEACGVVDGVTFAGAVDDAARDAALAEAAVFAMPSRNPPQGAGEGFGIVYLEAGGHRLPVVAANVGGATDAVIDGVTGLLVDPDDHVAVADALIRLLEDEPLAARLGAAGRARAEALSWSASAAALEGVLDELVEGGR